MRQRDDEPAGESCGTSCAYTVFPLVRETTRQPSRFRTATQCLSKSALYGWSSNIHPEGVAVVHDAGFVGHHGRWWSAGCRLKRT